MTSMTEMSTEKDAAIALLRSLIGAQPKGEAAVQAVIAERLEAAGCAMRVLDYDPASVPLVGEFASDAARNVERRTAVIGALEGEPELRSLLMFAHPDGEPVEQTESWSHDPFTGEIDGGRQYGWGIADDLAGCAAAVLALEKAARTGQPLGRVSFASTPSKRHARGVHAVLHDGEVADASLYLHPAESGAGMGEIKALASGQLEFVITVQGRMPDTTEPGHTSFAHLAVNPVDKAMVLCAALSELDRQRGARVAHPRLQSEVGRSTNLMISNIRAGEMRRFSRLNQTCEFGGTISFPPGETIEQVMAEVEGAIAAASKGDEWLEAHLPRINWRSGVTGAEVTEDHPFWAATSRAVKSVTGQAPFVNPMHTSSDIRNPMVQKGIPCLGLGCLGGDLTQNGRHDEWIDVADFLRMVEVTAAVVENWCSQPRQPA